MSCIVVRTFQSKFTLFCFPSVALPWTSSRKIEGSYVVKVFFRDLEMEVFPHDLIATGCPEAVLALRTILMSWYFLRIGQAEGKRTFSWVQQEGLVNEANVTELHGGHKWKRTTSNGDRSFEISFRFFGCVGPIHFCEFVLDKRSLGPPRSCVATVRATNEHINGSFWTSSGTFTLCTIRSLKVRTALRFEIPFPCLLVECGGDIGIRH